MDKLLEQLAELIKNGTDLVSGQLPDVAQQIIAYELATLWAWAWFLIPPLVLGLLIVVVGFIQESEGTIFFGTMASSLLTMAVIIAGYTSYDTSIKLQTAPKVFIIEKLMRMGK